MAAISGTDLALTTARVGAARVGSFRVGFIPCAVTGPGSPWFGEYIWDEVHPPTTQWTLQNEDCVCGQHPDAAFTMTGESVIPTGDITGVTYLDDEIGGNEEPGVTVTIPALGLSDVSDILGAFSFAGVAAGAVVLFGNKVGLIEGTNNGVVPAGGTVAINIVVTSPI